MKLTRGKKIFLFGFLSLLTLSLVIWNGVKSYERSLINSITGPTLPVFPTPTEKTLSENKDKLSEELVKDLETALADCKKAIEAE
ncbi:MAG: hypothetical protein IH840_12910, partial [Candidatus Heimdallarchaeota archaeon]|nr:hypothetical protein [Candidatus Heimdallarchaeota archaeon]